MEKEKIKVKNSTLYVVIRPGESEPILGAPPGVSRVDALWNARDFDERLMRIIQPNRTGNLSGAKRAGYRVVEADAK